MTNPIAAAGLMENVTIGLQTVIVAYLGLFAQLILLTRPTLSDSKKIGQRPKRLAKRFRSSVAPLRMAIWRDVR
jgi:hypothetical protein